jgi:hypothetical protein
MADSQQRSMTKSENDRVTKSAWMTSQKMTGPCSKNGSARDEILKITESLKGYG